MATLSESFEQQMLESMKRGTEEEMMKEQHQEENIASREKTDFQDRLDDSFDTSWSSTYKIPPPMQPQVSPICDWLIIKCPLPVVLKCTYVPF